MNLKHPSVDQATCTMQYRASKLDPIPANVRLQRLTLSPVLMLEMDIRSLTTELDEYLEEFVWEEFGDDGDEETVGVWDRILGATRSSSANGNGTGADSNSAEGAGADSNSAEGAGADGSSGRDSPLITSRLGSFADYIPAADRREFPGDNEPDFPQDKRLSGIRARNTTLASLIGVSSITESG
ncbi:hypothetical protein PC113_g11406 [Phytophthora cactorum]|uniref:Uncharacterized protein n=1 Tax=Phytophthora cactorum TaxID=29920 RepID=A0A8T0Z368_9STRA|nr:hypothetical protein PC111_g9534 [Phytophthora cactorum]KAG2856606.1 hypothetical protein PC113_g11406 [Phytophthora cactorum]KAG2904561.1 hypothetical protein PC114_g11798 [Phytophthora cactorum]KAG2919349.1 hypothetical protein PC115_g10166 [Phytophthora cactorum]KAG3004807.1 hypothetical protein PC120_g18338 [Phytophthora cactorum]